MAQTVNGMKSLDTIMRTCELYVLDHCYKNNNILSHDGRHDMLFMHFQNYAKRRFKLCISTVHPPSPNETCV